MEDAQMSGSDKRRPPGIEYGQLNPEAINSDIRLLRFTPISTISQQRGGDVIRFQISNDGFMDPYSTYLRITMQVDPAAGEVRWLDRSAHSLIGRLVIRSNGVEIERIENYDVMAAMINDMIYSPEQLELHHWEGFPTKIVDLQAVDFELGFDELSADATTVASGGGTVTPKVSALQKYYNKKHFKQLANLLYPGSQRNGLLAGEHAFFNNYKPAAKSDATEPVTGFATSSDLYDQVPVKNSKTYEANIFPANYEAGKRDVVYRSAAKVGGSSYLSHLGVKNGQYHTPFKHYAGGSNSVVTYQEFEGTNTRDFIIPLYSGFMGVLQPIKKFIPLMALPLDIEFTLNTHALYSSHSTTEGGSRAYKINRFEIMSHVIFFDSEVNFYLENTIANYGLYMHCNSFALAPVTGSSEGTNTIQPNIQIGLSHKSINSLHILFYYQNYESESQTRKLHFVSHKVRKLHVRNGPFYLPSEPLTSNQDTSYSASDTWNYSHVPFLVELFKAWGKMHDPKTDSLINETNWGIDIQGVQRMNIMNFMDVITSGSRASISQVFLETLAKQALVGRTQYAISFEGEELGEDKTLITGRAARSPFDLIIGAEKAQTSQSYSNIFIRHDFIVQIRPDLVVQVAGR